MRSINKNKRNKPTTVYSLNNIGYNVDKNIKSITAIISPATMNNTSPDIKNMTKNMIDMNNAQITYK